MAYEISTTTEIAATPENVWAVLADGAARIWARNTWLPPEKA